MQPSSSSSSSSGSDAYNKFMQIANSVETSIWGHYQSAEKLLGDVTLPQDLVKTVRDSLISTRTPQEVGSIIRMRVANFFKQSQHVQIASRNLTFVSRYTEFGNFARRHVRIAAPEEMVVTEFFKGHPLRCFNFTGCKMTVTQSQSAQHPDTTCVDFPTQGITLYYNPDTECLAFFNPEISKHSKHKGKKVIEAICLDEQQYKTVHTYEYEGGAFRDPHPLVALQQPMSSHPTLFGPDTGIVGLAPKEADEVLKGMEVYQDQHLQIVRFKLPQNFKSADRIFSLLVSRYLAAKQNPELVMWRPHNDPYFHLLERSYSTTQVGTAALYHFIHSQPNTSLNTWRFTLWPQQYWHNTEDKNLFTVHNPQQASIYNRGHYLAYQVDVTAQRTPFEDVATHGILFDKGSALVGNAQELEKQAKAATQVQNNSFEHTCRLVTDVRARLAIAQKIFSGVLTIRSPGLVFNDDVDPRILFDELQTPTIVGFTPLLGEGQNNVQISAYTSAQETNAKVSSVLDARGEPNSFSIRPLGIPSLKTLFPYGQGSSSMASAETETGEVIFGRRLLPACRITPISNFRFPIIELLKTIHEVFGINKAVLARLATDYLTEYEEFKWSLRWLY